MKKDIDSISSFQLFFFVTKAQLGVGIITFPAAVYLHAKHDAWISVLLTGSASLLLVFLYSVLLKRFDGMNLLEICQAVFGKWIGKVCGIGYLLYFLYISFLIYYTYIATLRRWILLNTPVWVIFSLLVLVGMYYGKEKLQNIARFCQLTFWFIFLPVFFSLSGFSDVDWDRLFPVLESKPTDLFHAMKASSLPFFGFGSILLIFPLVNADHKKKIKATVLSILFVMLLLLYFTVYCIIYFSGNELKTILEPTLFLFKTLTFYKLIERLDLIFLSVWIFIVVASYVIYIYLAHTAMNFLQEKKERKTKVNLLLNGVVLLFGLLVPEIKETAEWLSSMMSYASVVFLILIPLFALIGSYVGKKKEIGAERT